jgi:hypothetical protein
LSDLLGGTKDRVQDKNEKSGIYEIKCSACNSKYIGQTKRKLKVRFKEHEDDCKKAINEEKPLAKHSIEFDHPLGEIKLLKEVQKAYQLDTYESLYLFKNRNENLINVQSLGNNPSVLYKFV